jgi:hypothetical protein
MRRTILAAICLTGLAPSAHAQSRPPTPSRPLAQARSSKERIRISVNAADQVTTRTLTQSFSVPINVEAAPIATSIGVARVPLFDIGGSYRFVNRLAVGVSVSSLSRDVDGTLDAKIPHPFYFNALRPISGNLSGLQHKETDVHVYAMYFVPVGRKLTVGLFGGPSHFNVKQDFVTDVDYTASYPFDTAAFTGAPTENVSTGVMGYNAGVDLSWRLSKVLAIGGLIRFTGASTTLSVARGNDVDARIGGLQTGAGIRIIF